jgi:hypothetical protein
MIILFAPRIKNINKQSDQFLVKSMKMAISISVIMKAFIVSVANVFIPSENWLGGNVPIT